MSHESFDLMGMMTQAIAVEDAMANTLGYLAQELDAANQDGFAAAVACLIRHHRVHAMELRGQLAALNVTLGIVSEDEL